MGKVLNQCLKKVVSKKHSWKVKLLENWDKIAEKFKDKVIIEKIQEDLLVLGVCHPTWAQELFLNSDYLKREVNKFFKEEKIKKIQFRIVNFDLLKEKMRPQQNLNNIKNQGNFKKRELTPLEDEHLRKVKDKILQESLKQFYFCCKDRKGK